MRIDKLESVQSGGATQWIRGRGADAANPVLLLIQQGPGLPMINEARRFERVLGLEQAFTVVYWDQRGCGRSLRRRQDRAGISRERLVDDTVSLLNLLHDRFGVKIHVAGFSFGATLGAYAAAQRPDLVAALVAAGMDIDGGAAGPGSGGWWRGEGISPVPPPVPAPTTSRSPRPASVATGARPGSWRPSA